MKTIRKISRVLCMLSCCFALSLSAQPRVATLQYWFDHQVANAQSVAYTGEDIQALDVSALQAGLHTLEMRVGDSEGRWSCPVLRYFIITVR